MGRVMSEIEAGILVGGQSRRFGKDKASLRFGDTTLIERIYEVLKRSIEKVWIVGKSESTHGLPANIYIEDVLPNAGPMGGLLTILKKTNKPVLLVSCDTPFIETEHINYLLDNFEPELAATIAVSATGVEPLFGIYQPFILPQLYNLVSSENPALYRIFEQENVKFVNFSKAGYIAEVFFNINTLSDYKKALYLKKEILDYDGINSAGGKDG
jgi:molybdopterin-guanine dinucleotide biosynthesis protein A